MSDKTTEDNSFSTNLAEYRRLYPLLDEYMNVFDEHFGTERRPITAPSRGLDVHKATRVALARLGRPTDKESVYHAWAYIEKLREEVDAVSDKEPPTLTSVVAGHFWPTMDHLPTPAEWAAEMAEDQQYDAEAIAEAMTPAMLAHAVQVAMPALLQEIIDEDTRARAGDEKARLDAVAAGGELK